jgi:hypothetical protein
MAEILMGERVLIIRLISTAGPNSLSFSDKNADEFRKTDGDGST